MVAGAGFEQVPRTFDFSGLIFFVIGFVHWFVHRKKSAARNSLKLSKILNII